MLVWIQLTTSPKYLCACAPNSFATISQGAADEVTALLQETVLGRSVGCIYITLPPEWWPLGAAIEAHLTSSKQLPLILPHEEDSCL